MTLRELISNIANYFGEIFSMIADVPSSFVNSFLDAEVSDILFLIGMIVVFGGLVFVVKAYGKWLEKFINKFEKPWVRLLIAFPLNPIFMYIILLLIIFYIAQMTGVLDGY